MKIKLFCCADGCKNWIRTDKATHAEALRAGWRIPISWSTGWDGYACCPVQHFTVERVTVADIRIALKGLPGDLVMMVGGSFEGVSNILVGARKARNRDA